MRREAITTSKSWVPRPRKAKRRTSGTESRAAFPAERLRVCRDSVFRSQPRDVTAELRFATRKGAVHPFFRTPYRAAAPRAHIDRYTQRGECSSSRPAATTRLFFTPTAELLATRRTTSRRTASRKAGGITSESRRRFRDPTRSFLYLP
ncbi:hypothetical protein HPB50_021963 [Hyalomma asiaticum]|uniref:Uncharacterized protein n=1 Tax=Hyalomma asiaticum TaxID=266040 RepID=A0ACB7TLE0_HYAAI|nr:hypothetical protein HPB50_021963 [Hyalomma asiaticum]